MKKVLEFAGSVFLAVMIISIGGCLISQPTFHKNEPSFVVVDVEKLKAHVVMLSETLHPRDWKHTGNLNKCAEYIAAHFEAAGASVDPQIFHVRKREYRNVIGRFGAGKGSKIIVGAHYDSCGESPGADDNASGVSGLIELAYLLGKNPPDREIELVAYSLEEPPFFGTSDMGSAFHAKAVAESGSDITGVIVLEMIGLFSDERGSQSYPTALLKPFYPNRGNFIGVIGRWDQGDWIKQVKVGMKGTTDLPVYSIRAPAGLPGIDFSDHRNYWPHEINALMVTDTAFYRNKEYHSLDDTADRLDYKRMSDVVIAVFETLRSIQ